MPLVRLSHKDGGQQIRCALIAKPPEGFRCSRSHAKGLVAGSNVKYVGCHTPISNLSERLQCTDLQQLVVCANASKKGLNRSRTPQRAKVLRGGEPTNPVAVDQDPNQRINVAALTRFTCSRFVVHARLLVPIVSTCPPERRHQRGYPSRLHKGWSREFGNRNSELCLR